MNERVIIARMRPMEVIVAYVACALGVGAIFLVLPCMAIPGAAILLACLAWWYPHPGMLLAGLAIVLLAGWLFFAALWMMEPFPGRGGAEMPMVLFVSGLITFVPAAAIVLLTTSLRLQSARIAPGDHPSCEQCGYDLRGHDAPRPMATCPECGRVQQTANESVASGHKG